MVGLHGERRKTERKGKMFPITGPPQREKKFFFREIIIIIIFRRGVFTNFVIEQNYTLKI
jgi:hypothetical protein